MRRTPPLLLTFLFSCCLAYTCASTTPPLSACHASFNIGRCVSFCKWEKGKLLGRAATLEAHDSFDDVVGPLRFLSASRVHIGRSLSFHGPPTCAAVHQLLHSRSTRALHRAGLRPARRARAPLAQYPFRADQKSGGMLGLTSRLMHRCSPALWGKSPARRPSMSTTPQRSSPSWGASLRQHRPHPGPEASPCLPRHRCSIRERGRRPRSSSRACMRSRSCCQGV